MDISAFSPRLRPYRIGQLQELLPRLESAIDAGVVPNALFVPVKDAVNRAVDEAFDHYQAETKDYSNRTLVMGAYNLPAAIKEATKQNATGRLELLQAMLPLHTLLQTAKPLIRKRGEAGHPPAPKTAEQIAREAATMTCQCCGRGILANTGTIAHHGYERPGSGWQTASCMGAKELPFEVSRDALGRLMDRIATRIGDLEATLQAINAETIPLHLTVRDYAAEKVWNTRLYRWEQPEITVPVTRATFETVREANAKGFRTACIGDFDVEKQRAAADVARSIRQARDWFKECQTRFQGWKQTHRRAGDAWEAI